MLKFHSNLKFENFSYTKLYFVITCSTKLKSFFSKNFKYYELNVWLREKPPLPQNMDFDNIFNRFILLIPSRV